MAPLRFRRRFFAKHNFSSGSKRKGQFITRVIDAFVVTASVAVVWLIIFLVVHFTTDQPKSILATTTKHLSIEELRSQIAEKYDWKIYWVGPRDSKEFTFQAVSGGVVQLTYIAPNGVDLPEAQSFTVFSAKSEEDRAEVYHRINALKEATATSPQGRKIVFDPSNMTGERVYIDEGVAAIEFPAPQTIEELENAADTLVSIN